MTAARIGAVACLGRYNLPRQTGFGLRCPLVMFGQVLQ